MADTRIRVLWVVKGLGPGGMERLLLTHAILGDHRRFDYRVADVVDRPHSLGPELERLDVSRYRLDSGPVGWARSLRRIVREHSIDIVHFHSPALAAVGRPALSYWAPRVGVVSTEHNTWDCYSPVTRFANLLTYPLDDHRFAVATAAVSCLPRRFRGRSEVLVHGASSRTPVATRDEVRAALDIPRDAIVAVVVANHRREKAWDVLIDAVDRAARETSNLIVLGVGQGDLEQQHRGAVAERGLAQVLRVLGYRSDVPDLLAAADFFLLASRQEGLPVAVMEAMGAGLPVVATSVGGLPDVVDDGVSGILVPAERPQALAAAVVRVANDAALRRQMSDAAREAARVFDPRRAVETIESRYLELVG